MADFPVFLVEDDAAVRKGCEQALSIADIPVRAFADAEKLLAALATATPALVVSDVRLPGRDGLTLLRELRQHDRELPVLLMTGHGDVAMAVEAMREGAYDFIEKPFPSERLVAAVRSALEKRALLRENRQLKERLGSGSQIIGQSPAMQQVRQLVGTLAPTGVDILINGETGCGKEVVARAIHDASGRRGPFVAINCGALPETVFESELFGHEAGAFTGAGKRRIGRIEHANGGTLFLDEIESMPLNLQVKLLRVLQERSVERLGSNTAIPVDCRLVAASKTDLKTASTAGQFRADLYYRLNVVSIDLPPLRQRREDIALLMAQFLQDAATRYQRPAAAMTPADLARWTAHDWPGNVRELKNVADRWALGLPDGLAQPAGATQPAGSLAEQVEAAEKAAIEKALLAADGNVARAAETLKLPKKTLYDKLTRHALVAEDFRRQAQ
ncbi:sigma-54-dependent transcriptional regulator [Quatrionicoccus australiensis]|uniref:sigma-54-dependent transcriptional regulator n=1 Tax=Quatrionicoccus australiensis TaxID=138118 RepID=UPI001CFB6FE0|nr:sigma-54 dependent transcriptional regulator [Quatrionicoccus australiensis]MCB4359309.1 sigma-54-dependent Fis family transcriptional regulator [Quatrionicoccus australiensis]